MGKRTNLEYTTIQISKDVNSYVRALCKTQGWVASTLTEKYWLGLISSSMTGSLVK